MAGKASKATKNRWIVVRNWEKFQHYSDRNPPWIKNYLELLHDDAYRNLTPAQRGILHGLWLMYASARGVLRENTAALSRAYGGRITSAQLKALNRAGFIGFRASKPLAIRATRARALARGVTNVTPKEGARTRRSGSRADENGPPPACPECGVGGGLHASDCTKAEAGATLGPTDPR